MGPAAASWTRPPPRDERLVGAARVVHATDEAREAGKAMTTSQRKQLAETLRQPHPQGRRSVEEMRAGFRAFMAKMKVPDGIGTEPSRLGSRPALEVRPRRPSSRDGIILYFHGGGFVVGSPETALSLTAHLVVRTGMRAFSVDYRLAPEAPFPAAIEDALGAYRALLERGTSSPSIAFAGDSAGGGLCVTTCLAAREAGLPLPAALVVFSPDVDASRRGASIDAKTGIDPFFTRESLRINDEMYLGGQSPNHPWLTPAVSGDLTGFPPMLVQAGTNEVLLDDATRLAARARDANVDVILDITADVPHVFQTFVGVLDEAGQALDRAASFILQHVR